MKICSVIVTFNRKELLLRCVEACLSQSVINDVLIFDNNSSDGTEGYLREKGFLSNSRIIYHKEEQNIGGAGGFSSGMRIAYNMGYDYIWLMDDDGYPFLNTCLEECLKVEREYIGETIVNALVTSDDEGTLSFRTGGFLNAKELVSNSTNGMLLDSISPFNGTLISKSIIDKIGFPRKDFFIKGDETEYSWRAVRSGIKLITAVNAVFRHPQLVATKRRFLFYTYYGTEESFWKEYYHTRNYVYIYKTYFGKKQLFKHIVHTIVNCITYKEDKKRKRKYMIKGLIDGFQDKFENISF